MLSESPAALLTATAILIVAFIFFAIILRYGKTQIDKERLQTLYKNLCCHFSELQENLESGTPKSWDNYKKLEHGFHSIEFYPPVKELKRTGDILFLKKDLARESLELEKEILNYGQELIKHIPEIHAALLSDMKMYKEGYALRQYHGHERAHFETANPQSCHIFSQRNYCILFNREEAVKLFQKMETLTEAIEFISGDSPASYSAIIYPGGLASSEREYVEHLFSSLENNITDYKSLCNRGKELSILVNKLTDKLARRALKPIRPSEIIGNAFLDLFR